MSDARDLYREYFTEKLWHLLPEVYRATDGGDPTLRSYLKNWTPAAHDPDAPGPLFAFIHACAVQAALLRRSQDRLGDDRFIELADDWAVPYLADLVATRLVSSLNPRARRVDVAKTIYYRRRKGTLAVLEQLIADMSGWDGVIVEEFRRLARMRHGLDPVARTGRITRTPEGGLADLRDARGADLAGSPFDEFHYTPDYRRPRGRSGWYGISKLGLHVHRLMAFEIRGATPRVMRNVAANVEACTFDPSGRDSALFATNSPRADWAAWHSAAEWELPRPIPCRLLGEARYTIGDAEVAAVLVNAAIPAAQRPAVAADLATLRDMVFASEAELRLVLSGRPTQALLLLPGVINPMLDTALRADCGKAALLPADAAAAGSGSINVLLTTGALTTVVPRNDTNSGNLEGTLLLPAVWPVTWPIGTRPLLIDPDRGRFVLDQSAQPGPTVHVRYYYGFSAPMGAGGYSRGTPAPAGAFNLWQNGSSAAGVRTNGLTFIADSTTFVSPPDSAAIVDARIVAADGSRPYLRLAANWTLGTASANRRLRIEGAWVGASAPAAIVLDGDYETVDLVSVTLDPGGIDSALNALPAVPLEVRGHVEHLRISRCILGAIRTAGAGLIEDLRIEDSILQVRTNGEKAIDAQRAHARIERTTVFAARETDLVIDVEQLDASELLCTGRIDVTDTQSGCFRFSARTENSRVPHPYESHVISDTVRLFTSTRFGDPGFAQLSETAPVTLVRGAANGAEIGAFASSVNPIKQDSLMTKVEEYMPFGLLPALINET